MSSSGYSSLVLGLKICFRIEEFDQVFKRFEPTTGAPIDLHGRAFRIFAEWDQGQSSQLPDDPKDRSEYHGWAGAPPISSWIYDSRQRRIHEWLRDRKVNEEPPRGQFGYYWGKRLDRVASVIVGKRISEGCSDSDSVMTVKQSELVNEKLKDYLDERFPSAKIELYLITHCG